MKKAFFPSTKTVLLTVLFSAGINLLFALQPQPEPDPFFEATRLYELKQYGKALETFQQAIAEVPSLADRYPEVMLKIAYCYYRTGQFEEAARHFSDKKALIPEVEDYVRYFALRSTLEAGHSKEARRGLRNFNLTIRDTRLRVQSDSILAELYFEIPNLDSARFYYRRQLNYGDVNKGDILSRLVDVAVKARNKSDLEEYGFDLLRRYPFHKGSKAAYREIMARYRGRIFPGSKLSKLFKYLSVTEQFVEAENLLNVQQRLGANGEQVRWYRIRLEYDKKNYWAVSQECQSQRATFRQATYLREVDLHIARCYMRLGFTDKAVEGYDEFARRYPNDALTPEVLWVIAWLSEKKGDIDAARGYYKRLITKYPRYEFVSESRFRIGLSYYTQDSLALARNYLNTALAHDNDEIAQNRYKYWIAKTYAREGDSLEYRRQLKDLSSNPFDDYYSLKGFLLTSDGREVNQFVDSLLWEMHHKETSYLPQYLDRFQKPLLVHDIFGERFAQRELNHLASAMDSPEWELLYALGEVNEHMQNFGRAFRIYNRLFLRNFSRKDWREWLFLVKHLYPLYFTGEVNQYAREWNLTPASIWAVIKKESAFEPNVMSYANAYGLMQIIPPTANRLTESLGLAMEDVRQLYDPNFNIRLGSYYLSELLKRYDGNLYYALAAYNAGEHRVDRWSKVLNTDDDDFFMENIEFEQTRTYVRGVMKFYWMYHLLIHPYQVPENQLVNFPHKVARDPWFREPEAFE
ncbi:MAG TPA: transglycosylase SLT domain-containing protein [Calditrichia bacterium]|nr:transglycosylase SLT domain-containing protein [Calditrichota bacterium]HQU71070.1 transglycosylase SLT domain-containing protein [Calditrichia bacterium]HQV30878.1 transglycosylase SLT domain-containing protein [Calditrichia bacterium]